MSHGRVNAKAMPDKDTYVGWFIKGLDGVANIGLALGENDVRLTITQLEELKWAEQKLSDVFRMLRSSEH